VAGALLDFQRVAAADGDSCEARAAEVVEEPFQVPCSIR
jgi:hypothetical protein